MQSSSANSYPVKVSVVLPTYNQHHYLPIAIESILNQTFPNFELIIVNDGCTDETTRFLNNLTHPKIRVVTQPNQGLPAALNNGFALAQGEYWTWTSTDNVVAPTWLEELTAALDQSAPEVGYAMSYYAGVDDNGKILFVNRDLHFDIPNLLLRHRGNASFLYRAELAKRVGVYDTSLHYAEDLDMWVRMAQVSRARLVENVLYYYRLHPNSMTAQQDKVRAATRGVVNKFLAKTNGKFIIDELFPSIHLSADPVLERWKARIWLATIAASATFYCPVEAVVEQLISALHENFEAGLLGNITHLLVKEEKWDIAAALVQQCQQQRPSDFLTKLQSIIERRVKAELDQIPYLTVDENLLASDCRGQWTQDQLLRNLAPSQPVVPQNDNASLEKIVLNLVSNLEDLQDHPEVWQIFSALKTPEELKGLHKLHQYLMQLAQIPQDPQALILINVLSAMCSAHTGNIEMAKIILQNLSVQNPALAVIKGALSYVSQNVTFA